MTNQNNAAQPLLTDDEIMGAAINASDSLNITRVHEIGGPSRTIMENAGLLELGRAIETAVLSKLRAPVADAQPDYPGATVADRLDAMADDCAPGSQRAADLRAAAAVWRKHLAGPAAQPKRSPYNASGSLSEYGIFPECDATQDPAKDADDALDAARYRLIRDLGAFFSDYDEREYCVCEDAMDSALDRIRATMQRTSGDEDE